MKGVCDKQVSVGVVILVLIIGMFLGGIIGKCISRHHGGYMMGYGSSMHSGYHDSYRGGNMDEMRAIMHAELADDADGFIELIELE